MMDQHIPAYADTARLCASDTSDTLLTGVRPDLGPRDSLEDFE